MGDLDCVSCVSDGLCVCSFVSVVVCVSPSKICVLTCTAGRMGLVGTPGRGSGAAAAAPTFEQSAYVLVRPPYSGSAAVLPSIAFGVRFTPGGHAADPEELLKLRVDMSTSNPPCSRSSSCP